MRLDKLVKLTIMFHPIHVLAWIGYGVHHRTAHLVSLKLRFFDAEYRTDYRELLELRAKVDDSTAGTSEHVEARREFQNHMDAMIERIKNDPDYENLDHCDLESLRHVLVEGYDKASGFKDFMDTLLVNWAYLELRFFDAEYRTDYRELLELRAKVDDSTAGTSEHVEARREFQNHMDAMIERIKNDPDYENLMRVLDCCDIVDLMQRLGGSAYKGLAEKCNGELDEAIRRPSEEEQFREDLEQAMERIRKHLKQAAIEDAELMEHLQLMREGNLAFPELEQLLEEQATELVEQTSIEDAELMERLQLMREGNLAFPELEQLFQETLPIDMPSIVLPDPLPRYPSADTSARELSSRFLEGYEVSIAAALAPDTGTAPGTSDLVPGTDDIIGDLLEADFLHF